MNRENLKILADYLLTNEFKESKFDISKFSDEPFYREQRLQTNCGSIGCAVGHGPYAGLPKLPGESWTKYSERVFEIDPESDEWEWCFSGNWDGIDNTPKGAARRILLLLQTNNISFNYAHFQEGNFLHAYFALINSVNI